ncbi:MAG: hypothetical protein ACYS8X_03470 [Planctomycetota bacterium]|jgi:hypothetical protein
MSQVSGQGGDNNPIPLEDDEPIGLVESDGESQVRQFARLGEKTGKQEFRRPLNLTGNGATRCRIFHSKISDASLNVLEEQINEWVDSEDLEIKHIAQTIGTLQGKTAEENLIVTVWY